MASITIMQGHKNLVFAACVSNETGAEFEEDGQWITISDSPRLTIPRYCFTQALDPEGQRARRGDPRLESSWRSLLLNKRGHLLHFDDFEIVIGDEKPKKEQRQYLHRFPDAEAKSRAEDWAERAGFSSLKDYINDAVERAGRFWAEQAGDLSDRERLERGLPAVCAECGLEIQPGEPWTPTAEGAVICRECGG